MNELGFIDVNPIAVVQIIAAYLLGSIAFGIVVSRIFALPDPRTVGSGNPGATNVLRSGKKAAAALTLLGDTFKGWFPVWLVMQPDGGVLWITSAVAIAVFVGHLYPVFYKFKGGKGVATALGVILALSVPLAFAVLLTWLLVFALSKYSSLAALSAAVLAPVFAWYLLPYQDLELVIAFISLMLIWRHRSNIQKLLAGTEAGFGKK